MKLMKSHIELIFRLDVIVFLNFHIFHKLMN